MRLTVVAPYVGAWIETEFDALGYEVTPSHPMWVRGLKLNLMLLDMRQPPSHPMWVRGLKPYRTIDWQDTEMSHPMWVRGLKLLRV